MEFLQVHGEEDLRSFPSGTWGIKEPAREWNGVQRRSGPYARLPSCPGLTYNANHHITRSPG